MRFTIEIDSDNDACQTTNDLTYMLARVIHNIECGRESCSITDSNGNYVGKYDLELNDDEADDE